VARSGFSAYPTVANRIEQTMVARRLEAKVEPVFYQDSDAHPGVHPQNTSTTVMNIGRVGPPDVSHERSRLIDQHICGASRQE
jgi:hypothetical protein